MSAVVQISRSALEHNLTELRERSAPADVIFIVKANAYGHGTREVTQIAVDAGLRRFGCLEPETARLVRDVIADPGVMVLAWQISSADDLSDFGSLGIDVGIGSVDQLAIVVAAAERQGHAIRVHLKVDSGLNRNGVPRSEWSEFLNRVAVAMEQGRIDPVGVWTHIAESSDAADEKARASFEVDRLAAEERLGRQLFAHLAASSASFRLPAFRFDAVRIGGHAYGIPSFDDITPAAMGLIPVMTLEAPCSPDVDDDWGDVFVLDAGYVDGIPGYAAGKVDVTIGGVRCPVLAVTESETIVSRVEGAAGEIGVLFGDGSRGEQTVREWGDKMGTLGDEITSRIPARLPRVIID